MFVVVVCAINCCVRVCVWFAVKPILPSSRPVWQSEDRIGRTHAPYCSLGYGVCGSGGVGCAAAKALLVAVELSRRATSRTS